MTTSVKTKFPGKFDVCLDIKYCVESDLLLSGEELTIPNLFHRLITFLKSNPHINYLLMNGNFPKVSPHSLINIQGLFECLGNYDSKLVGFPPISRLDLGNYSILPIQYILNLPLERRLFLKLVRHRVFN